MDPESSGHRRRRSSLVNQLDATAMAKSRDKTSRSPPSGQGGIQEDPKLERASDDERSTSEDVELDELSDDGLQDDEETGLTGKDKGKRKRKKRRNTLLDQRIAADLEITDEEKKEADQNVVKKSLINGLLIGLWYLFSLSISLVSSLSLAQGLC
jgi:solute carrier family 35 protein C2